MVPLLFLLLTVPIHSPPQMADENIMSITFWETEANAAMDISCQQKSQALATLAQIYYIGINL